jgi:hypothetical protein
MPTTEPHPLRFSPGEATGALGDYGKRSSSADIQRVADDRQVRRNELPGPKPEPRVVWKSQVDGARNSPSSSNRFRRRQYFCVGHSSGAAPAAGRSFCGACLPRGASIRVRPSCEPSRWRCNTALRLGSASPSPKHNDPHPLKEDLMAASQQVMDPGGRRHKSSGRTCPLTGRRWVASGAAVRRWRAAKPVGRRVSQLRPDFDGQEVTLMPDTKSTTRKLVLETPHGVGSGVHTTRCVEFHPSR